MRALANEHPVFSEVLSANSTVQRMRGLLGRDGLTPGAAMLIQPCGSIHTFGMRFAIDVIFLDRSDQVVKVSLGVKPSRMAFGGFRARKVLECAAAQTDLSRVQKGTQFSFAE